MPDAPTKTYGTLARGMATAEKTRRRGRADVSHPVWTVACEPFVAVRIKRLFAKVSTTQYGRITLSDIPEIARDLEWLLERYPMEMMPADRKHLRAQADRQRSCERVVQSVLAGLHAPATLDLAVPLREYQKVGADLADAVGGLLNGDSVGLGKTAQAIAAVCRPGRLPAVVVTLAHLPNQWAAEFRKFAPQLRVAVARSGKPEELPPAGDWPDVLVMNYHKLDALADVVATHAKAVVFDEAHELRHHDSDKYRAAWHLARKAEMRLALTATPIFNLGGEIFNVVDVLRPDALGTREEFYREWCEHFHYGRAPKLRDPAAFGSYLRDQGIMIRRTRADVGRELPALTRFVEPVESDDRPLAQVESPAAELARVILDRNAGLVRGEKMNAAAQLSAIIRQATGIAKAKPVAAFVRMLVESGENVLLAGWHREVYEIWLEALAEFKPAMFTGSESAAGKAQSVERFRAGESKVLIMSLRAGAGVDGLQHCCKTVVYGELDWSPAMHHQLTGRLHRDGQEQPVFEYFLHCAGGTDPLMIETLGVKKQQSDGILRAPGDDAVLEETHVDPDHIRRLAEGYLAKAGKGVA